MVLLLPQRRAFVAMTNNADSDQTRAILVGDGGNLHDDGEHPTEGERERELRNRKLFLRATID